ncbi:hypothetical protein [Effusibacillus dendaii]|uniref:Uncharacterized protein n=1 Tax=Effusibacillus dendaii TaxID=2743772 RepID=A0A7I8DB38_9BACL|nr:hypothetical protein [Effusibacillus dendaii]BCJ87294.1 hypothetical protein skT53_22790 [Effusibacillus dendaii]
MMDFELLLLSWTQLTALQMILGDTSETASLRTIEEKLRDSFEISNIQLVGRTLDEYAVAFTKGQEKQIIRFDTEEVESIYDV